MPWCSSLGQQYSVVWKKTGWYHVYTWTTCDDRCEIGRTICVIPKREWKIIINGIEYPFVAERQSQAIEIILTYAARMKTLGEVFDAPTT